MRRLLLIEAHEVCASGCRAEHAERRGRVPALFVVMKVHAAAEARFHFEACHVGCEHIATARAAFFSKGEQCGKDGRRWMAAEIVRAIVVIEDVGRNAVDERSVQYACSLVKPPDQRGSGR